VDVFDVTYKAAQTLPSNTPDGKLALAIYAGKVSTGRQPDEIIMFCVDKSSSMTSKAGFRDTGCGSNPDWSKVYSLLVDIIDLADTRNERCISNTRGSNFCVSLQP
jgi:hypothetical protein